ncbi:MAG: ComF family protein [Bacillota bacterium]
MISLIRRIFSCNNFCFNCGEELRAEILPGICNKCLGDFKFNGFLPHGSWRESFIEVYSPIIYEGIIKNLIFKLKYDGIKKIAYPLGVIMADYLKYIRKYNENSILIPIPLSEQRKEERGFNQARLLAEVIGDELKISCNHKLLCRRYNTPPLFNLKPEQRKMVLEGVFILDKRFMDLKKENIILVDDIYTTGSTLNEASRVFCRAGIKNIKGLTAGIAVKKEKFDKDHNL